MMLLNCCSHLSNERDLGECRNIGVPGSGASASGGNGQAQQAAAAMAQMARASGPSLAEVLKPEAMLPLLQVSSSGLHCVCRKTCKGCR